MNNSHLQTETRSDVLVPHVDNSRTQVLVVEDDDLLRNLYVQTLQRYGYTVLPARTGMEALQIFFVNPVDLVVLDVQLPVLDGFTVCTELRKRSSAPIIMISGNRTTDGLVAGISTGADSYLPKPFTPMELLARVHALLRRVELNRSMQRSHILSIGDIRLNETTREVTVGGEGVNLTPNEFRLLHYLMKHPDATISNEELLNHVWNCDYMNDMNFVRVTMSRLRMKIEGKREQRYLRTIHGRGYMMCSNVGDGPVRKTVD